MKFVKMINPERNVCRSTQCGLIYLLLIKTQTPALIFSLFLIILLRKNRKLKNKHLQKNMPENDIYKHIFFKRMELIKELKIIINSWMQELQCF